MEYRSRTRRIRPLLYPHARWIYRTDGVTTDGCCHEDHDSNTRKYKKQRTHRRTDESYYHRLPPLYHLHVERVSRRILCRMSYLCLAREEVMDERGEVTELCEWCV